MTQPIDPFRDDQARNAFTLVTPAGVPGHDMQLYDSQELLAQSVAPFLAEGVRAGQPLIVIARKPLWAQVGQHAELFRVRIGDVFRKTIDGRAYIVVRAFGDMVDVLASEGNVKGRKRDARAAPLSSAMSPVQRTGLVAFKARRHWNGTPGPGSFCSL